MALSRVQGVDGVVLRRSGGGLVGGARMFRPPELIAEPPSRSASRFLANCSIRLRGDVGEHAAAELRGLAGDGQVRGDDHARRVALVLELGGDERPRRCRCHASLCRWP